MVRSFARPARLALASLLVLSACHGTPKTPDGLPALDCTSEVAYQGVNTGGGVEILSLGNGKAHYEDKAIRQVNDELAKYVAVQTRLCREYNSGVVSRQEYNAAAAKTRDTFTGAGRAAAAYTAAPTDGRRKHALDALVRTAVPETERTAELELELALDAELPASVGGGQGALQPGAPLPTNARVRFTVRTSKDAYVYLFQKKESGAVAVLFPDPRVGVMNPMPAGAVVSIPKNDLRYRVNDEDLGLENVYIVASRRPVPTLDRAVEEVSSGKVQVITASPTLAPLTTVAPGTPPEGCSKARALELEGPPPACTRSRGLVLEGAEAGERAAKTSMVVRTDPGDDTIVKVFPFQHVTEAAYPGTQKTYESKTPEGAKSRGIVVEM